MVDLQINDVVKYLKCDTYFDILNLPIPTSMDGYKHYLLEEGIIVKQDNGLFAITNLGAILFARSCLIFHGSEEKLLGLFNMKEITD